MCKKELSDIFNLPCQLVFKVLLASFISEFAALDAFTHAGCSLSLYLL